MLEVMRERNLSVTDWAKAANVARTTVARPIKEDYPFVTSSRTLGKLAAAANYDPPSFINRAPERIAPTFLPVRHVVQAGLWLEVDVAAQDYPEPPRAVASDPAYSAWPQWLELVRGDSVDLEIADGSYAHVVDAINMGYAPRDGDFVVVERRRGGGALRERSVKQVAITGREVQLWPRSRNPSWNKPLDLSHPEEGVEVEIVGLVIGAYRGMR